MIGAQEFGPAFQRILLRATVEDPALRSLVRRFAEAGQLGWTDPACAWAWRLVVGTDHPTLLMIETEAARVGENDPARAGLVAIATATPDYREDQYVRAKVVEWTRRQVFAAGFEEARQAWNRNDVDGAMRAMLTRIEEMNALVLDGVDRGWFFTEFDERQTRRLAVTSGGDSFPCGVKPIDDAMQGGLKYGELEVPFGYSKVGKSFWCVQRGFIAARTRRRVLHVPLEGGRAKVEDRYEARFSHTLYSAVRRGDLETDALRVMRREYALLRDLLVVRGWSDREQWQITFDDLLAELAELRRVRGWIPDLVIVDLGDLLHAQGDSERDKQKTAFRQLKALSERQECKGHRGYAVCAPAQAVRPAPGADEREHVLRPRDIADCYEKIRISDAVISINRTNREKEQETARVSLAAYRDAEDGVLVRVKTDYSHGVFAVFGSEEIATSAPPPPSASS